MLTCPGCGSLAYASELKQLAESAQQAPPDQALLLWRKALRLLPADSTQHQQVAARIESISRSLETGPRTGPKKDAGKWKGAGIGAAALAILAKFKGALLLLFSQGKFLLLGLTKAGTLFSMFVSLSFYWHMFGWQLAAGLIVCIYIHEMGHVAALKKLGMEATAPMFIPGFGALILLKERHFSPREDARVGLAGPRWGLAASVIVAAIAFLLQSRICFVIAQWSAWINLFNLVPVWTLDGGRGFHALRRNERIVAGLVFTLAWLPVSAGAAVLAGAASVYGILRKNEPEETDQRAFFEYLGLCAALFAFHWLPGTTL